MRRTASLTALAVLALGLAGCTTSGYVTHTFRGDPGAALAVERLLDRAIKVECPSGVMVKEAKVDTDYRVDTDEAREVERTEVRGRTVRACVN